MKNKSFSMNKKLSSFIGLLLSDGSVYYDKSKQTFCIQFTNKLSSMRNYFKLLSVDLFCIENFHENRCKNAISVRFFSKKVAEFLFNFSPTYRTLRYEDKNYPPCKVPNEIKSSKIFSAEFLRSYASCDGSFYSNQKYSIKHLEICCYHPKLILDLKKCLNTLEIRCRVYNNRLLITDRLNLQKFFDSVGFLEESFVSDTTSSSFGISKNQKMKNALH